MPTVNLTTTSPFGTGSASANSMVYPPDCSIPKPQRRGFTGARPTFGSPAVATVCRLPSLPWVLRSEKSPNPESGCIILQHPLSAHHDSRPRFTQWTSLAGKLTCGGLGKPHRRTTLGIKLAAGLGNQSTINRLHPYFRFHLFEVGAKAICANDGRIEPRVNNSRNPQ